MEWLKELLAKYEAPDELIEKVMAGEKDTPYLPKHRFDELGRRLETAVREKEAQTEEIESLRSLARKQEEQQEKLTALQTEKENLIQQYENRLSQTTMKLKVENELIRSKARNVKAVSALLDLQKLGLENGEVTGLSEQLETLKKENDYLFESGERMGVYSPKAGKTKPDFGRMSDEEYFRYLRQDDPNK